MESISSIHLQTALMEEKETTLSGSPGISEPGSPPKPVSTSLNSSSGGAIVAAEPATTATATPTPHTFDNLLGKKKRGRPRKYDSDGNLRVPTTTTSYRPPPGFTLSSTAPSHFSSKKARPLASLGGFFGNTAGGDFIPHVLTVHAGEDVAGKIMSFAQTGPRGVCVLSANGAISNVTMRQPGSSGGLLTYEGRFEILSLSGSFTLNDNGSGIKTRSGGLSVSLAGPDGRVIGGAVAGLLIAATPIQIVMGSFMPNAYSSYKTHKKKQHRQHTVVSPTEMPPNPEGQLQEQTHTRESEDVTSDKQNSDELMNDSQHFSLQRPYPDINISLPAQ